MMMELSSAKTEQKRQALYKEELQKCQNLIRYTDALSHKHHVFFNVPMVKSSPLYNYKECILYIFKHMREQFLIKLMKPNIIYVSWEFKDISSLNYNHHHLTTPTSNNDNYDDISLNHNNILTSSLSSSSQKLKNNEDTKLQQHQERQQQEQHQQATNESQNPITIEYIPSSPFSTMHLRAELIRLHKK